MELAIPSTCKSPFDHGTDVDIEFTLLPMGWPLSSVDGLSHVYTNFCPQTPNSERSTSPFPTLFDFQSSFTSSVDALPFDPSPISCVASIYFPMASTAGHMSDFAHFSIPVTPTRPKYDSQYCPLGGSASQEYPPQPTGRGLAITQFNTHTNPGEPSVLVQCEHLSDTTSNCIAPNNPTDVKLQSPVQFPPLCPSTEQQDGVEPAVPTTPLLRTRTQTSMDEVRHKTTILQQQVQQCHSPKKRARVRKDTGRRTVTTVDGSFPIDSIELASTFKCPVEGCDKMYRRSEHMKRHIQRLVFFPLCVPLFLSRPLPPLFRHGLTLRLSVHGHARYSCDWCKHTTNRWDNLKAHIKLHGTQREQPGSKPRVQFAAGAVLQYEEIMKNESRRGHGAKQKKRASPSS